MTRRGDGLRTGSGSTADVQRRWTVKVRASVKRMCEKCKIVKRGNRVMVICENPKHKQKQG